MDYRKFWIKNFKGIGEEGLLVDVGERRAVITLVGLNESGKTTILEALSHLGEPAEHQGQLYEEKLRAADINDIIPLARRANFNDTVEVTALVVPDDGDVDAIAQYANDKHGYILDRDGLCTEFTLTKQMTFESSIYKGTIIEWGVQLLGKKPRQRKWRELYETDRKAWNDIVNHAATRLPVVKYFPTFLFEIPEKIVLNPPGEEKAINRYYREVVQDVLDSLDMQLDLTEHITRRALRSGGLMGSSKRALDQVLLNMGVKASQLIFGQWDQIMGDQGRRRDIRFDLSIAPGPAGSETECVELSIVMTDGDASYLISDRSLGFRWFFGFLLFTQFRMYRRQQESVVFLLDEPASNLHPKAQQSLLRSFDDVSKLGARIVYSTHSPHMINPCWLENAHVVRNLALDYDSDALGDDYSAKSTSIRLLKYRTFSAEHPFQTTYFQPILDALEVIPSPLEYIPKAILLEGKTDLFLLNYFLPKPGTSLIPGTGANGLDRLIGLYLGWGRSFLVPLDDDKEGRKARERYIEEWGLDPRFVLTYGQIGSEFDGMEVEDLIDGGYIASLKSEHGLPSERTLRKKELCRMIREESKLPENLRQEVPKRTQLVFRKIHDYLQDKLAELP
ncbi:MAG: hypothetical protein CME06_04855 [Gemmatimonadetes bacterium]|nr:hypothetical protein [Gemmatimonadota bacterium]